MVSFKILRAMLAFVILTCFAAGARAETTWYVDDDASSGGDGTTWSTAHDSLSTALAAAQSGDQIWVAAGTYVGNFTLALGVEVYGGFAGTETELTQRDWTANPTILDGNASGSVVTSPIGATETTRIDGFRITNGSAGNGGGLFLLSSSPTIANNTVTGNSSSGSGALYFYNSSATIVDNTIVGNSAFDGGGLYVYYSSVTIAENTITDNIVHHSGGGLYLGESSATIVSNSITGNSAYDGGGLYLNESSATIVSNTITGNNAGGEGNGGGLFLLFSSPTIANNTFTGNSAGLWGGGLYLWSSSPTIESNAITDNTAVDGGGLHMSGGSPSIVNNMIIGNSARGGRYVPGVGGVGGGLYLYTSTVVIAHNTIMGNSANENGGGLFQSSSSSLTITNNAITNNRANGHGGGLYLGSSAPTTVVNNTITGNSAGSRGGGLSLWHSRATVANNTITGSSATFGGGMYLSTFPTTANNTIVGNAASQEGGGVYVSGGFSRIANTIVAFNSSGIIGYPDDVALWHNSVYGNTVYDYSGMSDPSGTGGNASVDPLFIRTPDDGGDGWGDNPATPDVDEGANDDFGNLRLSPGSPCINAGSNGSAPRDTSDLDGHARVLCGDVDMGAYESGVGDYQCDGDVDLYDFTAWEACMTGPGKGPYDFVCQAFDFEFDGDVDLTDFAGIQARFSNP